MGRTVRTTIKLSQKPSAEQISEIKAAAKRPVVFDEDSPEFTYEEMVKMIKETKKHREDARKQVVTLRLSTPTVNKAKAVGKGYTSFLSRLIENAINDKDLVSRSL